MLLMQSLLYWGYVSRQAGPYDRMAGKRWRGKEGEARMRAREKGLEERDLRAETKKGAQPGVTISTSSFDW
jgi:hypothetical protein